MHWKEKKILFFFFGKRKFFGKIVILFCLEPVLMVPLYVQLESLPTSLKVSQLALFYPARLGSTRLEEITRLLSFGMNEQWLLRFSVIQKRQANKYGLFIRSKKFNIGDLDSFVHSFSLVGYHFRPLSLCWSGMFCHLPLFPFSSRRTLLQLTFIARRARITSDLR